MKEKGCMGGVCSPGWHNVTNIVIDTKYSGSSNNMPAFWQQNYPPSHPVSSPAKFYHVYELQQLLFGKGPI